MSIRWYAICVNIESLTEYQNDLHERRDFGKSTFLRRRVFFEPQHGTRRCPYRLDGYDVWDEITANDKHYRIVKELEIEVFRA